MATIIFDFDDTLFDTKKLKRDIFCKLQSHGIENSIIKKTYKECRHNYCPQRHVRILKKNGSEIPGSIKLWISRFDFKPYLFEKVHEELEFLSKENYLILLTKGDLNFQKKKINGSNISLFFKEIHIIQKEKEDFLKDKNYKYPIHFINDKKSENKKIKKLFPKIIVKEKK
jgi:FMN phosphatase YigB (HAD superfamily)